MKCSSSRSVELYDPVFELNRPSIQTYISLCVVFYVSFTTKQLFVQHGMARHVDLRQYQNTLMVQGPGPGIAKIKLYYNNTNNAPKIAY